MSKVQITEEHIQFSSSGNRLEGILSYPDDDAPQGSVLFLSPHPHMGGNMDNNVIRHLSRRFSEEGALSLRFNYRGVGKSEIDLPEELSLFEYWAALESEERYDDLMPDVRAAHDALEGTMPGRLPLTVIGYSLGGILALKMAQEKYARRVVAISPPNKKRSLPDFRTISTPLHCIGGEQDFVFDPDALAQCISDAQSDATLTRLPDVDHFFRKQEDELFQHLWGAVAEQPNVNEID
ncbi:MAG: alpha/beta hydrolase [Candidatus Hydrogenedentota bacterium]